MRTSIFLLAATIAALPAVAVAQQRFPDYADQVPPGYTGPTFRLSQDYPKSPAANMQQPWMQFKFDQQPDEYMFSIRAYLYDGMDAAEWQVDKNQVRKWFHVPWMHVGRHPREAMRGMTRERSSDPGELGPGQTESVQNWAVGFYNEPGGYAIGKVWADSKKPDVRASRFPVGTVVAKILFTAATTDQVPELIGAVEWDANINSTFDEASPKAIKTVRLLQMDVAVRDSRADSTTGWVFGTFVYDRNAPGSNGWEKMMPVGVMWGNDEGVTPAHIAAGKKLAETRISPRIPSIAKQRLGWAGRLNGPVDNSASACLSCHSTSQWQVKSPMAPRGTDQQRLRWFRNLKPAEPFDAGQISLDYSLQMAVALQNFNNPSLNPSIKAEEIKLFQILTPGALMSKGLKKGSLGVAVER